MRFGGLSVILVILAVSGQAQEGHYLLEAKANRPTIQVNGNTQIELTISGLKIADLTKVPVEGFGAEQKVLLRGYIGYEPKTPGIKKIGPFEFEFQGEKLRSEVVLVEVEPSWPPGEERYQFQVFPRQLVKGEPIRITFRQQYSGKPLVEMGSKPLNATIQLTRNSSGEQITKGGAQAKSWTSEGSSVFLFEGKTFQMTTWWCDIPTPKVGKISITREDLPALPADIVFEPVEVEVVETKDVATPSPARKEPHPTGAKEARLVLNAQPRTIMLGDSLHLGVLLKGVRLVELGEKAMPAAPQPYEWSQEIQFGSDLEFTPETSGEKTYGPFEIKFEGARLVSNSQTVEVVPTWPQDAEQYEFRIFPRTVVQGSPIRVTYCEQYSEKPRLAIPYNNPRSPDSKLWSSPGIRSWTVDGRKFSRMVSTFDIPSTKVGKMLITRDDLPSMDASITFEPIEVEVARFK
ncbi:hypothetical protein BH09VER1_BH09VER1_03430 [soil metagenome]